MCVSTEIWIKYGETQELSTPSHVVPISWDICSSAEHKIRHFKWNPRALNRQQGFRDFQSSEN